MQIALVKPGRMVAIDESTGTFLRLCGSDALVELANGARVMWSGTTEVEILTDEEEIVENELPKLEVELARLENFSVGKYAPLGVVVITPCTELPKTLHSVFVLAALGAQPIDGILCRRCGKKSCVRADHLFWGTRSDCQRDMVLRGAARPSGKQVTLVELAARIVRLRSRISRVRGKLGTSP